MSGKEQELIDKGYDRDLVYKLCDFSNEELEDSIVELCEALAAREATIEETKEEIAKTKGFDVCGKCGQHVEPSATFCPKCGAKMEDEAEFEEE